MIVTIERQSRTLRVLRVRSDPGILVREAPCLDRRASRMRQTSTGNLAINIRLQLQILGTRIAVWINRQGDVHLGDVDLYSQRVKRLMLAEMDATSGCRFAMCI